jgi:hypothetical protein
MISKSGLGFCLTSLVSVGSYFMINIKPFENEVANNTLDALMAGGFLLGSVTAGLLFVDWIRTEIGYNDPSYKRALEQKREGIRLAEEYDEREFKIALLKNKLYSKGYSPKSLSAEFNKRLGGKPMPPPNWEVSILEDLLHEK